MIDKLTILEGRSQPRYFVQNLLLFFIPSLLVLGTAIFLFFYQDYLAERQVLESKERNITNQALSLLTQDFRAIVADLKVLADLTEHHSTIFEGDEENKQTLSNEFLFFSRRKQSYDQIRYLNEAGEETVRVNFNNGKSEIVPEENLQNKAKRYYFKDAFQINSGSVYVSPLDLNIERGRIERPQVVPDKTNAGIFHKIWRTERDQKYAKPMIRFGTPVFNADHRKTGIVLINFLGAQLLNRFDKITANSSGRGLLVNHSGYWIKGPTPQHEWAFMDENADTLNGTFRDLFPNAWQIIQNSNTEQFYTDAGLFTVKSIFLLDKGQISSTGSGKAYEQSEQRLEGKACLWKIMTFVPTPLLNELQKDVKRNFIVSFSLLLVLLMIVSWIWAVRRNRDQIRKQYATLLSVISQPLFSVCANGQLLFINDVFAKRLGGKPDDFIGSRVLDVFPGETAEKLLKDVEGALKKNGRVSSSMALPVEDVARWYEARIQAYAGHGKSSDRALVVLTDITERIQSEQKIKASLKEKETLLQEIHHRVKNNMNVVSSLLELQMLGADNEFTKRALQDSQNRVLTMSKIHEMLYQSDNLLFINMQDYLTDLGNILIQSYSRSDRVSLTIETDEILLGAKQASPLGLVVNELVSNALKYAFPGETNAEIRLKFLKLDGRQVELRISDNGIGFPQGVSFQNAESLGLKLVKVIVENQLSGSIDTQNNGGTTYIIRFDIDDTAL